MMQQLSAEARNLNWLVSNFVERVPGVREATVVSSDGLLIAISDGLDRSSEIGDSMTRPGNDPRANGAEQHAQHALVRPYMLTRGRTSSSLGVFELHAPALALITTDQLGKGATPEDRRIIELCQTPMSVAELSARLGMPVGVVRVLVG